MKTLAFALAMTLTAPAFAQQQQQRPPTAEEIQQMAALLGPVAEHKDLEALAGTWSKEGSYNMGGGQKMTFTGRTVNRMTLGGRFLLCEGTTRTAQPGFDVEMLTIYGFDRRTGDYTIVGYDTMGTYYVTAKGKKAAGTKELSMRGEVEEGGGMKKYDMVLRWVDRDTYVSEIIFHLPAGPLKVVEITHRRVK